MTEVIGDATENEENRELAKRKSQNRIIAIIILYITSFFLYLTVGEITLGFIFVLSIFLAMNTVYLVWELIKLRQLSKNNGS